MTGARSDLFTALGRNDFAAGLTRVLTISFPLVGALVGWFFSDLIYQERATIATIISHQHEQDIILQSYASRITTIEADRNARIQEFSSYAASLNARFDRTDEQIDKLSATVVRISTQLADLLATLSHPPH